MRTAITLLVTLLLIGCGDAETKDNVATNAGNADMGTSPNADNADAGNTNSGNADSGNNEPFGTVCPGPGGELASQECSVVDQECETGACEKRILLDDMQVPTAFAVVCGGDIPDEPLGEGDVCGVGIGECEINMVCKRFAGETQSLCRVWCRLEDAYGCRADQACVPSSDLEPVFGVCADECPG